MANRMAGQMAAQEPGQQFQTMQAQREQGLQTAQDVGAQWQEIKSDKQRTQFDIEEMGRDWQKLQAELAFQDQILAINQQYDEAKLQMKQQMWSRELNAQQSAANAGIQLVAAFGSKSFQAQKNAAIATSLVNIAGGVAQALNNPYPANLGFAAQVALEGASLISTIKSTNISGGGSSASISSASATLPTTPQAAPTVGAFEITGLAGLQEQLDRLDNDEVLPVSFTKRLVASLESVQRLQGA